MSSCSSAETRQSALSISRHATALEICDLVYSASAPSWEALERFYEANATYENPIVTATSRSVIADIHALSAQLAEIDVPRPLAVLYALFGLKRERSCMDPWFRLMRAWNETTDVCESESFDGHRKVIVEHTLHILILPGIHSASGQQSPPGIPAYTDAVSRRSLSLPSPAIPLQQMGYGTTLGLNLLLPSPLHLRLPVMSQLSFNDVGKITYHRDIWDIKDLLGLIPGMTLAQWISGRVFAQSARGLMWLGRSVFSSTSKEDDAAISMHRKYPVEQSELSSAAEYARAVKEAAIAGV
ncbi:hypothetical protein NM688_g8098 [Phlebia brevispora]|uniref:Uncharacterized protein n=1 Tax=Phlebia brevispora TaxID=194682 RepID=A0ACC1RXE2_9APHY|nr:hypothetical protein NM688_g8098 [Phlebia brevispora]